MPRKHESAFHGRDLAQLTDAAITALMAAQCTVQRLSSHGILLVGFRGVNIVIALKRGLLLSDDQTAWLERWAGEWIAVDRPDKCAEVVMRVRQELQRVPHNSGLVAKRWSPKVQRASEPYYWRSGK